LFGRIAPVVDLATTSPASRRIAAHLVARAKAARDEKRFREAATLFGEAVRLRPNSVSLHKQSGHMCKEAGDLAQAEQHYLDARRLAPKDAELWLQLGHFYKVAGRLAESEAAYRRAAELRPGWVDPKTELAGLLESGWRGHPERPADEPTMGLDRIDPVIAADLLETESGTIDFGHFEAADRLAPKLVPRRHDDLLHNHPELIDVRHLGRREPGYWGIRRTLRGLEAVRGFCVSSMPVVEMQILLNGLPIHRGPLSGGYVLKFEREKDRRRKYVFNVWLDFSPFVHGLYALELRFRDAEGETRSFHDHVVIGEPLAESDYPGSDALLTLPQGDARSIEEQVRSRPSMVRPAKRAVFPDGIRNVLVLRTDQLGDMIASIPAMVRLRELVPGARIVGLLTGANADLARSLNLFDEVIVVDFPDDRVERRRLMPLDKQEALRCQLAPYRFDLAIDLAQAGVSRELLLLSGAPFRYGVGGEDWPWMAGEFIFNTHDRLNRMDVVPHSSKVLALVEALGAVLRTTAPIIRRDDLGRDLLAPHGIGEADRFVVLHMGARIEFSRWPYYRELAARLLRDTDLKVVMMTEDPEVRPTLGAELTGSDRFLFLDTRLTFDVFDAFVSHATVLVGNDSGPKHLASLRGTNVVTLFTARINWSEWGQENVGSIISRRVPCAGCAIFHDPEECGKEFACIRDISVDEVFGAVMQYV
jgi:ADP-heptose:LPS heptosyltransferase/tetratricopeptide (TPR) repeat protein